MPFFHAIVLAVAKELVKKMTLNSEIPRQKDAANQPHPLHGLALLVFPGLYLSSSVPQVLLLLRLLCRSVNTLGDLPSFIRSGYAGGSTKSVVPDLPEPHE